MKTAVCRVLLMSALMSPGALYALGLGEIHLNSALNQPFDAEIELVSATQEDLGALRAALASNDTFARYGLDRPAYLSDFSFRVAKGPAGNDVLRVTSPKPVTEPFVTLLVEANWPRGRLLREYTVLLDPPVFTPGPAATETVATPRVTSGSTTARSDQPVTRAVEEESTTSGGEQFAAAAPARAEYETAVVPGGTYLVRRNDTLWKIASAANPGTRADVNRAMVSIYQTNPDAFDGNINVLRSGSTLRIPETSQIEAIQASTAAAEVSRQYEAWRNAAAARTAAGDDASRLRLVTPEQGAAAPSTTPPSQAPASAASSTPGTAAAADIDARVRQLEAELAEARRLLEVRNAELATLQGGAAAVPSAVVPPTETPATAGEPGTATAPVAVGGDETTAKPEKPAKPPKKKRPAAAPEEPSLLERLGDYWWVLLGLLALGLGYAFYHRTRRERGSAEEHLEEALGTRDSRSTTPRYTPRSRDSDILVEEKRAVEPLRGVPAAAAATGVASRAAEPSRKAVAVEDTTTIDGAASTEAGDPLAEADFHMAYGLYDQAADLVQVALKREPQRRDLRLKLLEIYFVWGNRDRFLELARELNVTRTEATAGEWDKVLIMGKQIAPDEPMFAASPSAGGDSLDMELHGSPGKLDMDITGMPATSADLDLTEPGDEGTGLDFVLDDGTQDTGDAQVAPTIETPRVRVETGGDTQELTVDALGLDVGSLRDLDALDADDTVTSESPGEVEDTVETPKARAGAGGGARSLLDEETDALSATSMVQTLDPTVMMETDSGVIDLSDDAEDDVPLIDQTGQLKALDSTGLLPTLDDTGVLPELDDTAEQPKPTRSNFDAGGEPPTMSEVGTKLDLARAYMDMGDPEGARSILDEVLQEGSTVQRQEAERLIASLP